MGKFRGTIDYLGLAILDWLMPPEEGEGQTLNKTGTNQKIPVVYGEQMVEGIEVFKRSSDIKGGPWNEYLHMVYILCEGEVDTIGEVFFNDISENDPQWGGDKWVHIERFNGADDQAACQTLIDHGVGWTQTAELNGLAYIYVRLRQNTKQNIFRGQPSIKVHIEKGKKIKNLATGVVEYSNIAPYCLADYISRPRYGRGASEIYINKQSFIDSAAITHQSVHALENQTVTVIDSIEDVIPTWETIDWSRGGWKWDQLSLPAITRIIENLNVDVDIPLMPCDVTLQTSKDLFKNINILRSGMRGMTPNSIGEMELIIEDSGLPTFDFNNSNIKGGIELTKKSRSKKCNQLTVTFKNKALNFEDDQVVYPETGSVVHTTWLAEDYGVDLPQEVKAETLINRASVLKWAEVVANLSRDLSVVSFKSTPETDEVFPGDIVSITDSFYGWVGKAFRVMSKSPLETGYIQWSMVEHQDSIYPWADPTYSQDYPKTNLSDPFALMPPTGVTATVINNDQVRVSWFKSGDPNVYEYVVVIRDAATEAEFKTLTTSDSTVTFNDLGNGEYEAVVYGRTSFSVSKDVIVEFEVTLSEIYPPIFENDASRMYFVPNDARVRSYAEALHFRYSLVDDFDNAAVYANNPSSSLIIEDVDGVSPYHVWYGDGTIWYYIVLRATTSSGLVDISAEMLDDNLSSFLSGISYDLAALDADVTEDKVRTMDILGKAANTEIELQVNKASIGSAESAIVRIDAVSEANAVAIQSITSVDTGIYANATEYTRTAVGYWDDDTWVPGPIAENILDLRVQTASGYSRLKNISQVFETDDGKLIARGGMVTDVNNKISGFFNHNDGTSSQFDIISTIFRVGEYDNGDPETGTFKPYIYAQSGSIILENSWLRADAAVIGVGTTTYNAQGKPILAGYSRTNIGNGYISLAAADDIQGVELASNGEILVVRRGVEEGITIDANGVSGGTAILVESGAGVVDFQDGAAPFTGKHSYIVPPDLIVGQLIEQGELHKQIDVNNSLFFAHVCSTPRSRLAIGSYAQSTPLGTYKEPRINEVDGSVQPSKLRTMLGISQQDWSDLAQEYSGGYINAIGDGAMMVCSESGNIIEGQLLCSSSLPGHAMLQTDELTGEYEKYFVDYTVAKALETVIWDDEPENTKLIAVYYKGG